MHAVLTAFLRCRILDRNYHHLAVSIGVGIGLAGHAWGQQSDDTRLQEIVVTATKRETTLQSTPISITAVSGQDIEDRGFTDFTALAQSVPGVSMRSSGPGQTEFEIRGLTSSGGNSPTVGFYLDDTPLTPPAAALNGKVVIDPSLYDLSRVEVLRGPQGTLYGSGSMGGTIKLVSNQPSFAGFDASGQIIGSATDGGGFNHDENGMLNIPLIDDQLALRLVVSAARTSGWIDRIVVDDFPVATNGVRGNVLATPAASIRRDVNDENLIGSRLTLRYQPTDRLTITPGFFYQRVAQGGPNTFDSDPGTLAHYEPYQTPEPFSDRFSLWSLNAVYKFDAFDVTSSSAQWNRDEDMVQDESENLQLGFGFPTVYPPNGPGPGTIKEKDSSSQFSQELRLTSTTTGAFSWLVGGFFSSFRSDWDLYSNVPGLAPLGLTPDLVDQVQPTKITQRAAFGEVSYQLTSQLKATLGLRYYNYSNAVSSTVSGLASETGTTAFFHTSGNESDHGINPKFDLSYTLSDDLLVYTTASKGFRPGGGNEPIPTGPTDLGDACTAALAALGRTAATPFFKPDTVWSYELGEKAAFLDKRVTVNSAAYLEKWSGVQQVVALSCGFPYTDNAGAATIYGSELEVKAVLFPGLVLSLSGAYTHAQLTEDVLETNSKKGDLLQDVAPWTADAYLSYTRPLIGNYSLSARIEDQYVGQRQDAAFFQHNPLPEYSLVNLRTGVTRGQWTASVFANNVFNKQAWLSDDNSLSFNLPTFNRVATNQPLTIGLDVSYHYGAR